MARRARVDRVVCRDRSAAMDRAMNTKDTLALLEGFVCGAVIGVFVAVLIIAFI